MKKKFILTVSILLGAAGLASAATNDMPTLLQRGLFEEEANHQLDAAITDYKGAVEQFDHERQLAATAIFRLGECYRKLGRTNEANAQYERIVREFSDQPQLAQLSRGYLPASGGAAAASATETSALPPDEEKFLREVKEAVQNSPDLVNRKLSIAVYKGYIPAVEFLLAHGADVNMGFIDQAASSGNEAMVQLLLSHGAEVNSHGGNSEGNTALHNAAAGGFMTICQTLLAHGADVNAKNNNGWTPLRFAAENGYIQVAELLITNNAQINARDRGGDTPLSIAIRGTQIEMIKLLLDHHADANMEIPHGGGHRYALLFSALERPEIVKLLLEAHADPNVVTSPTFGESALMWAATSPKGSESIQLLLDHGAKVNATDSMGQSALVYAIQRGNIDGVRILIAHGADVNILDKNGGPPLSYITSPLTETSRQIKELLIKAGADTDYNRRCGIWTYGVDRMPKTKVFACPSNSINHYTLLEFVATLYKVYAANPRDRVGQYSYSDDLVAFPDFARVAVHRLDGKRAEVLHINVADIFQSRDCSKDVALRAGDLIEIPEQEHKVADIWNGLSATDVTALNKCLLRLVRTIAQGQTNDIELVPSFADAGENQVHNVRTPGPQNAQSFINRSTGWLTDALNGRKADIVVRSFLLNNVVHDANVLLNTSDLSKVRLTRGGSKWTFDLTATPTPDVWLEDGDVIEIPELGESTPAPAIETK